MNTPRDEDEEWEDSDWDEGADDDDSTPVVECPQCGREVYEEADQCPACGEFFVPDTRVWTGKPWWWAVLGLAGVIAVIIVLSSGAFGSERLGG
jgi:hypothetical protein